MRTAPLPGVGSDNGSLVRKGVMQPANSTSASPARAEILAALLIGSNLIALALADHDRLLFVNAAFRRLFDRAGGLTDVSILDLLLPAHREQVGAALRATRGPPPLCVAEAFRGETKTFELELRFEQVTCDGAPLLAIFAQDVTDRYRVEAQLNLLAFSDPLTGLGNRAMFADRLRHAMLIARRTGQFFAVLALDLDNFKPINDGHGHAAGDLVLQRIAARVLACLRDTDTVVRLGGDEFAVLIPNLATRADAMTTANRLIELARQPISLGRLTVRVGASVGIAIYPEHASTVDLLLAAADRALYAAKRRGRGRAVWATEAAAAEVMPAPLVWSVAHEVGILEIDEQHGRLVELLNQLTDALRNGEVHDAALQEVVRYTKFHFATEERLMRNLRYDGAAAHRDMHQRLLEDLNGLCLDGAGLSVSLIVRYLREWLLRHVDGADRDLAAALLTAAEI
jgi:diguanylate cyclase (GGDEF)-like protein/hemerythrin-like metal-binding protein